MSATMRFQGTNDGTNWTDCAARERGECAHRDHRYFVTTDWIKFAPDPAQAAPCKAPEGYEPCPEGCGRWKSSANYRCWECHLKTHSRQEYMEALVARTPDWTPPATPAPAPVANDSGMTPLESKPAETGHGPIRPGSAMCCPLGYLDKGHSGWCKSAPPAQEAPKAVGTVEFWQCDGCASDDDTRPTRFDSRLRMYCKPCRAGLEAWAMAQSGKPYAGPERLERTKMAHSMGVEDPALEDA